MEETFESDYPPDFPVFSVCKHPGLKKPTQNFTVDLILNGADYNSSNVESFIDEYLYSLEDFGIETVVFDGDMEVMHSFNDSWWYSVVIDDYFHGQCHVLDLNRAGIPMKHLYPYHSHFETVQQEIPTRIITIGYN